MYGVHPVGPSNKHTLVIMVGLLLLGGPSTTCWALHYLVGLLLLGGPSTTCWAFYYMLGLLLLTECSSCKKDVAATHPVSQDPACDQTGGHHQRRHHILLMSGFPMLQIRLIIIISQCNFALINIITNIMT